MVYTKYEVIATGSSGNAVLIDDVLVDCGIPYSRLKPYLAKANYLLITHIHSDHVNKATFKKIKKLFPRITIIGNHEVAQIYEVDIVANNGFPIQTKDYTFTPVEVPHDVLTYAYTWVTKSDERVLYVTDTYDLSNISDTLKYKYDLLFIESNHDEKKLEAVKGASKKYGYDVYWNGKRHLSTQQSKGFYYTHRKDKDSVWIELHQSSRFY